MAFSEEKLRPVFDRIKQTFYCKEEDYIQNVEMVYNYLAGNISSLSDIHAIYTNIQFRKLAELFTITDEWTANDDLLISLYFEPKIHQYTDDRPIYQLYHYISSNSEKSFNKGLAVYKKFHSSDEKILHILINGIFIYPFQKVNQDLPYVQYILNGLRNASPTFINYLTRQAYPDYIWNKHLFLYLDLVLPNTADDFLRRALDQKINLRLIVEEILFKDFAKYSPFVIELINKLSIDISTNAHCVFELQIYLNQYNPDKNLQDLAKISEDFLHQYIGNHNNKFDENYFYLTEETKNDNKHFSTWAFYFISRYNKETGLSWINKMLENKIPLSMEFIKLITNEFPDHALSFIIQAMLMETSEYYKREYYSQISELLKKYPSDLYISKLWSLDKYKTKSSRDVVAFHLSQFDSLAVEHAIPFLNHKKADIRLMAVHILCLIGSTEAIKALSEALNNEKNDDARDAMLYSLAGSLPTEFNEDHFKAAVSKASERGKLDKAITDWLDKPQLPPLFLKSGRQLSDEEIRFIVYRMSRVKEMRIDPEARAVLNFIDRDKSTEFAKKIFKLYGEHQYDVKLKFIMTISALTGNHEIVDKLRIAINEWIEAGRKVMSEYGIIALALQGSDKALRWVEWYSRKYKSKKAYVGEIALLALQNASEELGITIHELGDRIIPDFGFDGLFKNFTAGDEEYRAFIDSKFKLSFFDEDNQKLKSVPASASEELKEEFKNITKEVKDIVKSQSMRLEHYLTVQRKWKLNAWQKSFLENPVMFIYATKILWAVYKDDKIKTYFICQEDTTLVDVNDEEISLTEDSFISMAHPYFLSEQELKLWKQKFFDLSREVIFPQLDREVTRIIGKDIESKIVMEFKDIETENSAIKATLEKKGWGKGQTGDGGYVYEFMKDDHDSGIQAIIEVTGVFVGGYGNDFEPKLGRLYFIDKKIKKGNSTWFVAPKDASDERLIQLKNLPPVFYSEVMSDIKSIKLKASDPVIS